MKLSNKGQALVEYVIIIGLITILTVALVTYFGGYLKDAITKSSENSSPYFFVSKSI